MKIDIESDEHFRRLLTALAQEVVDANIHWRLLNDLEAKAESYSREYNQSVTFWSQTLQAHLKSAIFCLIRIYDGNAESLSLCNLLDTIAANMEIFDEDQFRKRLKDNPFVNSLAEDVRKSPEDQLRADREFSSNNNEIVKKLTIWRSNLFAHKNAENVLSGKNITSDYPLNHDDIETLVGESIKILNRYSQLFGAVTYSTQMIGHDDYEFVLESIRHRLESHDKHLEEEVAKKLGLVSDEKH